jgi:hypothetical protein
VGSCHLEENENHKFMKYIKDKDFLPLDLEVVVSDWVLNSGEICLLSGN